VIRPEALEAALDRLLEGDSFNGILERFGVRGDEGARLASLVSRVASEARGLRFSSAPARERWAMGRAMPELLGRVHPAAVRDALEAALEPIPAKESHV